MGLFSSLGSVLGGAVGSVFGPVGTVIGAGLGNAGGGAIEANRANKTAQGYFNQQMDFAREQMQFQQDYAKNVAQWRVEDAKKAGLHPMAALGISSPSYSPVSAPSSPSYSSGMDIDPMEFGQSLNYASAKAKDAKQQQIITGLTVKGMELDNEYKQAQIDQLKVDTLASSIASNQAFQTPAAPMLNSGQETYPGQGDALYLDKPIVRDGWLLDEHGRKVGIIPSEDLSNRTEDKFLIEWVPWAGSSIRAARAKFLGQKVNGHWWHGDDLGFLPYPPKNKGFLDYVGDVHRFYSDHDY